MKSHRKLFTVVAMAAALLLFTGLQAASAIGSGGLLGPVDSLVEDLVGEDIVDPVVDAVQDVVGGVTGGKAGPAAPLVANSGDDDSAGHETADPSDPDHAAASVADVDLADGALVDGSATNAQVEDSGRASGDATVLSLLGSEIIGAHSASDGTTSEEFDILGPLCDATSGALCVQLLYASTSSSQDPGGSRSEAHTALLFACVGGTATNADESCDGPIGAGVGESHSAIERDAAGNTTAAAESDVADVCLGGENGISGLCDGLGVNALQARSGSGSSPAATARDSQLLGLEVAGENNSILPDPTSVTILPDCPPDLGVVCLYLNQGESLLGVDSAGSAQDGLHLGVLNDLVLGHVSEAETRVHRAAAPTCNDGQPIPDDGVCPGGPLNKPPATQVPGGPNYAVPKSLPVTGGNLLVPLALALNLMALGSLIAMWDRRIHGRVDLSMDTPA